MSCQHGEDACCQYCLEKVQTTTEDAQPPKKRTTTTEKTMTPRQKRINILMDSSLLASVVAIWYFNTKYFFNMAIDTFDSLLDDISTRTSTE